MMNYRFSSECIASLIYGLWCVVEAISIVQPLIIKVLSRKNQDDRTSEKLMMQVVVFPASALPIIMCIQVSNDRDYVWVCPISLVATLNCGGRV